MGQLDFDYGWNVPKGDIPTYDCMHLVVCTQCGRSHGFCSELNSTDRKENMDLSSHRSKDSKGGKFIKRDFLKASHIPAKGGLKVKIIDFRTAPKQMEYSDFLCDVSAGKKEYTIGLRTESVLLDMMIDELGAKTEKWPGKSLTLVRGGNKGQYVNVG